MGLSCSKKIISIIKRLLTSWLFLFSELSLFFRNRKKRALHKNVGGNKDFCNVIIPFQETKILEFKQHQKFAKKIIILYLCRS